MAAPPFYNAHSARDNNLSGMQFHFDKKGAHDVTYPYRFLDVRFHCLRLRGKSAFLAKFQPDCQ